MVLVKILMEIDPLLMRGSMVMTMVMISPSRRDVSPVEQLRRSPRLVLPKFCLEMAALRPESFLMIFPGQNTPYSRGWAPGACKRAHKDEERTLHPCGWMVTPSSTFFTQCFLYMPKIFSVNFRDFWSCAE